MKTLIEMRDELMEYVRVCWRGESGELDSPVAIVFGPGDQASACATDMHPTEFAMYLADHARKIGADGVGFACEAWAAPESPELIAHRMGGGEIRTFPGREEVLKLTVEARTGERQTWRGAIVPATEGAERTVGPLEETTSYRGGYHDVRFFRSA